MYEGRVVWRFTNLFSEYFLFLQYHNMLVSIARTLFDGI